MKKIVALTLTLILLLSCSTSLVQAKVGDVVGTALHTDIVVYINHFAVPSYIVNGQSVIVAEDLRNFGFDVAWDPYARTLDITRNSDPVGYYMAVGKGYSTGAKYQNILATDITVWADGQRINSFALDGYTMIPVEELTMFGEVNWIPNERALKMWIDGLEILEAKQPVSHRSYLNTSAPDFGWVTDTPCVYTENGEFWIYLASAEDLSYFRDYIENKGYYLQHSKEIDGNWFLGYINSSTRTGLALMEEDGLVQVQLATNTDYWK